MRFPTSIFAALMLCCTICGASAPNSAAPPETAQFGFLVGEWSCETRFMNPAGEYSTGHATWTGRWILDGWAIQDDWVTRRPDGNEFRGTNIRSYNPQSGKWDNRWISQGSLQWKYFESSQNGDTMVMIGGEGTDARGEFIDRNTFYEITEDAWRWRKDRSWDGGETWFEGIGFIEASRATPLPLLERVEHGFVDHNGVKLHYAAVGEGPLVVMLHGFPDYWYTWRNQMEALADRYRVVAVDLRGYNKSDKPEGVDAYAMRLLIGDVVAVIRGLGAEKAIVVGHDWGGAIAWQLAQWVPDVVDRLIVLSTPHPTGLMRELRENTEQQKNSEYARRFQEEGAHESLTPAGLAGWVVDEEARPHYIAAFERSSVEGMLNYYKANYPNPTTGDASPPPPTPPGKIGCPVLVLHGLDDTALMPSGFNGTWQWVDGDLTVVSIPGAAHFIQHEAEALVTDSIVAWLER